MNNWGARPAGRSCPSRSASRCWPGSIWGGWLCWTTAGRSVFPVNFVLDRHMVVFRTGDGTKLDAACRGSQVAFEIDGADAAAHTGWSVLIRGEAIEVTGPAELARLRKLPLDPWAPGAKTHYVRILPAVLTGRRIWAPGGAAHPGREPPPGGAARRRR